MQGKGDTIKQALYGIIEEDRKETTPYDAVSGLSYEIVFVIV